MNKKADFQLTWAELIKLTLFFVLVVGIALGLTRSGAIASVQDFISKKPDQSTFNQFQRLVRQIDNLEKGEEVFPNSIDSRTYMLELFPACKKGQDKFTDKCSSKPRICITNQGNNKQYCEYVLNADFDKGEIKPIHDDMKIKKIDGNIVSIE